MGIQEGSSSGRVDLKVKQRETGHNKVNLKSVMTSGVQLACICIWNRTLPVFPGKDGMPPGIFLKNFPLKVKELLYLECTGVMNPLQAACAAQTPVWGPPCAAAEMSLWAGAGVGFAMKVDC